MLIEGVFDAGNYFSLTETTFWREKILLNIYTNQELAAVTSWLGKASVATQAPKLKPGGYE